MFYSKRNRNGSSAVLCTFCCIRCLCTASLAEKRGFLIKCHRSVNTAEATPVFHLSHSEMQLQIQQLFSNTPVFQSLSLKQLTSNSQTRRYLTQTESQSNENKGPQIQCGCPLTSSWNSSFWPDTSSGRGSDLLSPHPSAALRQPDKNTLGLGWEAQSHCHWGQRTPTGKHTPVPTASPGKLGFWGLIPSEQLLNTHTELFLYQVCPAHT